MQVKKVWAVYFSATGTTRKTVRAIAAAAADALKAEQGSCDFTLPEAREQKLSFGQGDLVIFGTPVYAGRVPNVLLKYLSSSLEGNGALAVPVVSFGNRNFDDALVELRDILEEHGFSPVAAAGFVGEHSFSYTLAGGRPDEADLQTAAKFGRDIAEKLLRLEDASQPPLQVKGVEKPYRGYYQPRDRAGNPVDIRKVKPLTSQLCDDCKLCAALCPMGSISYEDVREFTGICIKCGACIKGCPKGAKYYDDPEYLYHKKELEEEFERRAEPVLFL